LREALALNNGTLDFAALTPGERGQVTVSGPHALSSQGADYIYFSPAVFSADRSKTIALRSGLVVQAGPSRSDIWPLKRPGEGEDHQDGVFGAGTDPVVLSPPEIGRGPGGGGVLGMGLDPVVGIEVPVSVSIDGTLLSAGQACLTIDSPEWVRGMSFQHCGTAIAVVDSVASAALIGSNGDGIYDSAETVTYTDCGHEYAIVPQ
jgi:hypothetical protein